MVWIDIPHDLANAAHIMSPNLHNFHPHLNDRALVTLFKFIFRIIHSTRSLPDVH